MMSFLQFLHGVFNVTGIMICPGPALVVDGVGGGRGAGGSDFGKILRTWKVKNVKRFKMTKR